MSKIKQPAPNPQAIYRPSLQINMRWAYETRIPEDRWNTHTVSGITAWHLKEGSVALSTVEGQLKVKAPSTLVLGPGKRSHHFSKGCLMSSINCQIQSPHGPYLQIPHIVRVPANHRLGEDIEHVVQAIARLHANPPTEEDRLWEACMHENIASWVRRLSEVLYALLENPFTRPIKHPGLARALAWLNEHPDKHDIMEQELAQIAGLSMTHFKRLLKQETKQSFRDMMLERKLSTCNDLLLRTSLPIKRIALEVGFNGASNFVRWFQQHSSHTPADYRKRHLSRI